MTCEAAISQIAKFEDFVVSTCESRSSVCETVLAVIARLRRMRLAALKSDWRNAGKVVMRSRPLCESLWCTPGATLESDRLVGQGLYCEA